MVGALQCNVNCAKTEQGCAKQIGIDGQDHDQIIWSQGQYNIRGAHLYHVGISMQICWETNL